MSVILLDTNVVSYLLKGDTRAAAYAPLLQGHRLAISFVTVAEWTGSVHGVGPDGRPAAETPFR